MTVEIALIVFVIMFAVHVWHVHKALERLEAMYMALISLTGEYISSLYNLAHTQLEQYATALQYPQDGNEVRYG